MRTWPTQFIPAILLLAWGISAHAAIYRCIDKTGNILFTQHHCASGQQSEVVNLGKNDAVQKPRPAVCKQVEKLAEVLYPHIAATDSILKIYTNLGGREYLSASITSVVNYVYNFRYNPKARQSNVVALTRDKCLDGGFGMITKKDLPDWSKITYVQKKTKTKPALTREQLSERRKACQAYAEKLAQARKRLAGARNKGQEMQARLDVEYYKGLQRDKCLK
ncbi:MAG: DUF4124 domain-containing protein [Gammaproteobacteria bacterium]